MQKLLGAHAGIFTLDLDQSIRVDVRLDFPSEEQAREGEKALRDTLELGRQGLGMGIAELEKVLQNPDKAAPTDLPENFAALVGLGLLRDLDGLLKEAPVQRQGLAVKLPLTYRKLESAQLLVSFFGVYAMGRNAMGTFDFVSSKVASGSKKDPIEEHLRNLAQALDKYHEKHGSYPPPAIYDGEGRTVLSWRVALLPYLGEEALYREFRLDEPWDSLHNKRLLKKLPKALQSPNHRGWGSARWKTTTLAFAGENTIFEGKRGIRKTDADKQTILLVHLSDDAAVYWTKPADLAYAADLPLPRLFGKYGRNFQVLLAGGTYRTIEQGTDEKTLRALIERSGQKPAKSNQAERPLPRKELAALWNEFAQSDDAGTKMAWQGVAAMIHSPQPAVPFLKERVKPLPRLDQKRIDQWLANLDSSDFQTREGATRELEKFGELAVPSIDKKLHDKTLSLEARRRMESLAEKPKTVLSSEELRSIRAVEVLEGIGTGEAVTVLDSLARGAEGAVLTEQAKKALSRLAHRARGK